MTEQRLHLILYKDALKVEKRKTTRYQELLAGEVETTSKLQKRLSRAKDQSKKPGQETKLTKMMHQLGAAAKERDEMHDQLLKTLEHQELVQQELDQLKAEAAQRAARELPAAGKKASPVDGDDAKDASIEALEARERMMEARIQQLTEDNDLLRQENEINNTWVDNQQGLAEALESVGKEKDDLEARVQQLEQTL
jgi:hypothetical protein